MFFRPLYIMAVRSLTYIKNSFVRSYPEKRSRGKIGHEAKLWVASYPEGNFDRNQLLDGSLVFRPYTQLRRLICTSESLRPSIRVSPDQGCGSTLICCGSALIYCWSGSSIFSNYGSGSRVWWPKTSSTSKHENSVLFSIFVGHFFPSGSGSGSAIWIRIRIPIQQLKLMRINAAPDTDPDPQPCPWLQPGQA
jgi:hypothetical protein